jgi:hypothetical protein
MLNAKPEYESETTYIVHFVPSEQDVELKTIPKTIRGNPIMKPVVIEYYTITDKDGDYERYEHIFAPIDLKHIDGSSSKFTYENPEGLKLILEKKPEEKFNYMHAI